MLGEPILMTVNKVLKLAEAVKLSERAEALNFKTSYKLGRLGDQVEDALKHFNKESKRLREEFTVAGQTPETTQRYEKDMNELLELEETVYLPKFVLSEFVYNDKTDPANLKDKMKVPQKFINIMVAYLDDDLVKLEEHDAPKNQKVKGPRKAEEVSA